MEQTVSARRLQRDYKELIEASEPLVGVAAKPLPDNLYEWHGNLRGPANTKWKDGVFHFKMIIPQDYPCSPPTVTLFTPIPHPNVFGTKICVDFLEGNGTGIYEKGWVSAYTIEAVLLQLQSFLFEELPEDIEKLKNILIGYAIKQANDFTCSVCKHRGPLSADPPFNKNEQDMDEFLQKKTAQELLKDELVCFQTKTPVKEGTLGIGITIKRSPRTGLCMYVNPTLDLMSMKSFTKLNIRKSISGEKFTHWFPLYFGEKEVYTIENKEYDYELGEMVTQKRTVDTLERFERHINKTMSFCSNGSTRKEHNAEQALHFMLKLIGTHVVSLMREDVHTSILAIRRLFNFFRILFYFMKKHPQI